MKLFFSETNVVSADKTIVYEATNKAYGILYNENDICSKIYIFLMLYTFYVTLSSNWLLFKFLERYFTVNVANFSRTRRKNVLSKGMKTCHNDVTRSYNLRLKFCVVLFDLQKQKRNTRRYLPFR